MFGTETDERDPNVFVSGVTLPSTRTGDAVDDVVADILADEAFASVVEREPVEIGGVPARVLRTTGFGDDRRRVILSVSGDDPFGFATLGFTDQFLVLDVDGQTLIIMMEVPPEEDFDEFEAEAYAFLETLRFRDLEP